MTVADQVILLILAGVGKPVPSAKLINLVYLVDYLYFQHYGRSLTGFLYQWGHVGPDAVGSAIIGEAYELAEKDWVKITCHPNIHGGTTTNFQLRPETEIPALSAEAEMVVGNIVQQYGGLSVSAIAELTQRTASFQAAPKYGLLTMRQSAPAGQTTEEDWEAYQQDLKQNGTLSLEEVKRRYGLA